MSVQLQQNPSLLERENELTSPRGRGSARRNIRISAYEKALLDLSHDKKLERDLAVGRQVGFYRIRGELGSGNFSQVKLGIHILTRDKVAVKILDKTKLDAKTQRLLSREISSMERLHHPNVIRLYEVIETLSKLHLVMEYASYGELSTRITNDGRLQESEAKPLFAQIVAAVEHMHQKGIIHRDLKAENVLFANIRAIKVADFGFSTPIDGSDGHSAEFGPAAALTTFCGSPPYAAPELFCDDNYYGVFVDIWALGILLYYMVVGVLPFRADTVGKLKKCIISGSYSMPSFLSDSCRSLVQGILHCTPTSRLTIAEMQSSAWLEGQDFPAAMEPFRAPLNGSGSADAACDWRMAINELAELGISTDLLTESEDRQVRSNIIGTYRIVLHRIQKRRSVVDFAPSLSVSMDASARMNNGFMSRSTAPSSDKKRSKICSIL